jgi:hypothetical protein
VGVGGGISSGGGGGTFSGSAGGAAVGVFYVITKFATASESLLVYYTITDKSASAWTPL